MIGMLHEKDWCLVPGVPSFSLFSCHVVGGGKRVPGGVMVMATARLI